MLQGLDLVPWATLQHAYGTADDVPDLLRALLDPGSRDEALEVLFSNIFHQGTRYQATPHAVPFLVELLQHEGARRGALQLLTACTSGHLSVCHGPFTAHGAFDASDVGDEVDPVLRDIEAAASRALGRVRGFLHDPSPRLRAEAAAFLACFRTRAHEAELVPAVLQRLAIESEPTVRVALAFALGHLLPRHDDAPLLTFHAHETHGAPKVMAAILLARRMHSSTSSAVVDTLVEALALEDTHEVSVVFMSASIESRSVVGDAAHALARCDSAAQGRALPALVDRLRRVDDVDADALLEPALQMAFGGRRAPRLAERLDDVQREVLLALVANDDGLWSSGNATHALTERGIAADRESLAQYLGVAFQTDSARALVRQAERLLTYLDDADGALELLDRALALDTTSGKCLLLRGFALLKREDKEGAVAAFRQASDHLRGAESFLARKNAGVLLGHLGRRDEALAMLEENARVFPSTSAAWYDLGLGAVKHGSYDRSVEAITRALALSTDDGEIGLAHYTAACAFALREGPGDVEAALMHIESALSVSPGLADSIRTDADFERIRLDPRFCLLVQVQ